MGSGGDDWASQPFEAIEDRFNQVLDESLSPRGPDMLYGYVASLGLKPLAQAIDAGAGRGAYAVSLRRRFGFEVLGIDPDPLQVRAARALLASAGVDRVRFEEGRVELIPAPDATADLIWCRDVLELVPDLERAFREMSRVLKPGGHALIYVMCATDQLEAWEAKLLAPLDVVEASMRPSQFESAIRAAGLRLDVSETLGAEWGEYTQEHTGKPARNLLHLARLQRAPDRYVGQFGRGNYEVKVADCLWHVYRMLGKLSSQVFVVSKP